MKLFSSTESYKLYQGNMLDMLDVIEPNSIDAIVTDPPYELNFMGKSWDRSGIAFQKETWEKCFQVLKPDGILIFKCQDKVSSSKQYMTHCFIYNEAIKIGYYPKDLFILLAKNRIVANWQKANQQNARKYHSYFWVFQKCDKVVKYTE